MGRAWLSSEEPAIIGMLVLESLFCAQELAGKRRIEVKGAFEDAR